MSEPATTAVMGDVKTLIVMYSATCPVLVLASGRAPGAAV
jgi:hypothetical protein